MLTDKELREMIKAWGNEAPQRTIVDLCRDVAKAQESAERERCAQTCEAQAELWERVDGEPCRAARLCAHAIRAMDGTDKAPKVRANLPKGAADEA